MSSKLLVLFNHSLTEAQRDDAAKSLGVCAFIEPPPELRAIWSGLPPEAESLLPTLAPVFAWLERNGRPGDHLLVQGDFGATFLLAQKARALGLIPIYSTTRREAEEERVGDAVRLSHRFRHVRFRRYEPL